MRLSDFFTFAACHILQNKRRSTLTALSVSVGVALVVLVSHIGTAGRAMIDGEVRKLGIGGVIVYNNSLSYLSEDPISNDEVDYIRNRVDGVSNVMSVSVNYGYYALKNMKGECVVCGIDENVGDTFNLELLYGRNINRSDAGNRVKSALIDADMAKKVYKRENIVGKQITLTVNGISEAYRIVGIIRAQKSGINGMLGGVLPEFIYVSGGAEEKRRTDQLALSCAPGADPNEVGERAVDFLNKKHGGRSYKMENISGYIEQIENITWLVSTVLSVIAGISLCVAGIGTMNAMISSMAERRREIGIQMAVGARQSDIGVYMLIESAAISLIGGIIGAAAGLLLYFAGTSFFSFPFMVNAGSILTAEAVSVMSGLIFGIVPAMKAARMKPIAALRGE